MKITSGITVFASSMFLPVLVLGVLSVGTVQGVYQSSSAHAIAQILVLLAGIAAWAVAMHGFTTTGSVRLLLIGSGFFGGSLLLALHGLLTTSVNGHAGGFEDAQAEWYSRLGMLLIGVFLFLTIGFAERNVKTSHRRLYAILMSAVVLLLVGGGWWLGELAPHANIVVAASAGLWTPLGRFLQIASILLLVLAAIRYLHGAFLVRSEPALAFATGIVMLAMSELTYASAQVSYDSFYWMAHLWLVIGFFSFLWGSVAAQQAPHEVAMSDRR